MSKQPTSPLSYKNSENNNTRTRCSITAPDTAGCIAHKSELLRRPHARPRSTFCRGFAPGQIFALRGAASCFVVFKDSTTSQHASLRLSRGPRAASSYQPLQLCCEMWNLFRFLREIHQNVGRISKWECLGLSPVV